MKVNRDKTVSLILFMMLFIISFFKDDFTPDYLNTSSAGFLNPTNHQLRIATISTHLSFWILSILYSCLFTLLPYLITRLYFNNRDLSKFVLAIHLTMFIIIYILVFVNNGIIDKAIVPKLNRYYHSPILLLFFIAAFTLTQRNHAKK